MLVSRVEWWLITIRKPDGRSQRGSAPLFHLEREVPMRRLLLATTLFLAIGHFVVASALAQELPPETELLWTEVAQLRAENQALAEEVRRLRVDLSSTHAGLNGLIEWRTSVEARFSALLDGMREIKEWHGSVESRLGSVTRTFGHINEWQDKVATTLRCHGRLIDGSASTCTTYFRG